MAENWGAIASEVKAAVDSIGFSTTITRVTGGPAYPSDPTPVSTSAHPVTVIDSGWKNQYGPGGLFLRRSRVLTIGAGEFTPLALDTILVAGIQHEIKQVRAVSPGGVDLLYKIELEG